jgi:hypothetical protein
MHQKEKRSMDHFAGLDVSVKETSVCIVGWNGQIVREVKVTSEPEALLAVSFFIICCSHQATHSFQKSNQCEEFVEQSQRVFMVPSHQGFRQFAIFVLIMNCDSLSPFHLSCRGSRGGGVLSERRGMAGTLRTLLNFSGTTHRSWSCSNDGGPPPSPSPPAPVKAPSSKRGFCFCEFDKLGAEVLLFAGPALDRRRDGDTVLEPSAGTGSLVAAATHPGVKIFANELAPRRFEPLKALVGDEGRVSGRTQSNSTIILPADEADRRRDESGEKFLLQTASGRMRWLVIGGVDMGIATYSASGATEIVAAAHRRAAALTGLSPWNWCCWSCSSAASSLRQWLLRAIDRVAVTADLMLTICDQP